MNWINHAGFVIEQDDIVLACDPWIEGKVFHDGWALLSESKFKYEDFNNVTHIWFSHEHPDHFNPVNIRKIDPVIRQKITILYQVTEDKKVIDFLSKLNFKKIIELPPSEWYVLSPNFKILNQNDRCGDSWLAVNVGDRTILNMNDVITYDTESELNKIKSSVGNIDVLMTQFSYASWAGNIEDKKFRMNMASEKMKTMALQARVLKPKFIIPFASFVWFCREENFYFNEDANKIEDVLEFIEKKMNITPVLPYPGDNWEIGKENDNGKALRNYIADRNSNVRPDRLVQTELIPLKELQELAKTFSKNIQNFHSGLLLKLKLRKPAKIFINDLNKTVILSLNGIAEINEEYENCDISLRSEALKYCLKFNWGGDTLNINGCFQVPKNGKIKRFQDYFYFSNQLNLGKKYGFKTAFNNITRKFLQKNELSL